MPFSPTLFGIAIDVAIKVLRGISDEQFNGIIYEEKDIRKLEQALSGAFLREHEEIKNEP